MISLLHNVLSVARLYYTVAKATGVLKSKWCKPSAKSLSHAQDDVQARLSPLFHTDKKLGVEKYENTKMQITRQEEERHLSLVIGTTRFVDVGGTKISALSNTAHPPTPMSQCSIEIYWKMAISNVDHQQHQPAFPAS